jgi:hypothetical protein
MAGLCVLVPSAFLGSTGGKTGGYCLVGVCVDTGDEVDKVAGQENENGVCAGVELTY